jgi:AbrB family looped-hinge helix DNA binding protein
MEKKTTIDAAGRVVIPKELRRRYGLDAGRSVRIVPLPDGVSIIPELHERRFVRHGPVLAIEMGGGSARPEEFDIDRLRDDRLGSKQP